VVATVVMLGKASITAAIMLRKPDVGRSEKCSSTPVDEKPSAAAKSSSLPNTTSANGKSDRFTSRARSLPPIDRHSDSR
jgi:hypothetical protein